jgi:hypothetical protein
MKLDRQTEIENHIRQTEAQHRAVRRKNTLMANACQTKVNGTASRHRDLRTT